MKNLSVFFIFSTVFFREICFARKEASIRVTRSVDHSSTNAVTGDLILRVQTDDSEHNILLKKPKSSVFSANFKLQIVSSDAAGRPVFEDKTPSKSAIAASESSVYLNHESNTALHVHDVDGTPKIMGHIGQQAVSHKDGRHFVVDISKKTNRKISDYVDLKRNVSKIVNLGRSATVGTAIISVQPELAVVFDNANYNTFKGNNTAMIAYLSLLIHSVNNRYNNIASPKIQFTVSGLMAISSTSAQPFITSSVTPAGNTYDINKILDSFAGWVYSNSATLPKHDLAPLLTGVHLQSKDGSGNYVDGVAGLAYVSSACWINGNKDLGTSVSAEGGGSNGGITTLTHELAHNLGAPHDGDGSGSTCPWSGGYIMSYQGSGEVSKFFFSNCSASAMNTFIASTGATCLKTAESPTHWTNPNTNAGDFMNMTTQCQLSLNNPKAYVDLSADPNLLCRNLICKYPDASNPALTWILTTNNMPADASYCGESGSCSNGVCVVESNMTTQCRTILGRPNAWVDLSKSPDSLCSNLVCAYSEPTNPSAVYIVTTNQSPVYHTPCGRQGRCINGACSQNARPVIPPSMTAQCQSDTGKPAAYVEPTKSADELCASLQCRYPDDANPSAIWFLNFNRPPQDYTPCGTNGNCLKGKCVVGAV